jgi:hypothetical protein
MSTQVAVSSTARKLAIVVVTMGLVAACSSSAASPGVATPPPATAEPTPAITPVGAAPSPTAALETLAEAANHYVTCPDGSPDDCLIPGTYRLGSDVLAMAVSPVVVPAGWFEWDMGPGTEGLLVERTDVKDGSGWGALFSSVGLVFRDPCDLTKGTFPSGSTNSVDGLIDAMTKWPGFQVSPPRPTTLGGVQGKQVAVDILQDQHRLPGRSHLVDAPRNRLQQLSGGRRPAKRVYRPIPDLRCRRRRAGDPGRRTSRTQPRPRSARA